MTTSAGFGDNGTMQGEMRAKIGAAIAVTLTATAAFAMSVRETKTLLARSTDGVHALYAVAARGPEGGGALTYRLEGPRRADRADFLVSSDFSPGGPSRPQRVSVAACARELEALAAALTRRGFRGVATHPARCQQPSRDGLLTVTSGAASP